MKIKIILLVIMLIWGAVLTNPVKQSQAYFYERIATPNGNINFVFGFYHEKYNWKESQQTSYTSIPGAVINNKTAQAFNWNDYKIFIMLRDGTLFRSYTTTTKSGKYLCKYKVQPGKTHYQDFAFAKKFKPGEILHVWLELKHSNFIKLLIKI